MKLRNNVFGALVAIAAMQLPAAAQAQDIELKMQFASPDGTSWNEMDRRFAAQVDAIMNDRAEFAFFPPNSVTKFNDWLQATGAGLLDIGFVWHPVLQGKFPQMELFSLPGLSPNQTIATTVYWRMRDEHPELGELFTEEDNVVEIATFVAMGSHLHTAEPIKGLADIKGKVFGAQDPAGVKVLEELGASASVMVGSDAYLGMQRGTIDGVLSAWGWVNNFKLNEVTDYHLLLNLNPGTYSTVMNKDTWGQLTPQEQAHLSDLNPVYFFYNTTDSAAAATADIPPENIFALSSEDQAELTNRMRPQWAGWVEKANAAGLNGQALLDEAERLMVLYSRN